MPIAPPPDTLGLWSRVEPLTVGWPDTNEDQMFECAGAWGQAAAATNTLSGVESGGLHNWGDPAGAAFRTKMVDLTAMCQATETEMRGYEATCMEFGNTVRTAKQGIVDAIVGNLDAYAQTLMLEPEVVAGAQQRFVNEIANWINEYLAFLAGQGTEPSTGAQLRVTREPSLLGRIGDVAGLISSGAGIASFVPGLNTVGVPLSLLAGAVALGFHAADAMKYGPTKYTAPTLIGDTLGFGYGVRSAMVAENMRDYLKVSSVAAPFQSSVRMVTDNPVQQMQVGVALQSGLVTASSLPTAMIQVDPHDEAAQEAKLAGLDAKVLINTGKLIPNGTLDMLGRFR